MGNLPSSEEKGEGVNGGEGKLGRGNGRGGRKGRDSEVRLKKMYFQLSKQNKLLSDHPDIDPNHYVINFKWQFDCWKQ